MIRKGGEDAFLAAVLEENKDEDEEEEDDDDDDAEVPLVLEETTAGTASRAIPPKRPVSSCAAETVAAG